MFCDIALPLATDVDNWVIRVARLWLADILPSREGRPRRRDFSHY